MPPCIRIIEVKKFIFFDFDNKQEFIKTPEKQFAGKVAPVLAGKAFSYGKQNKTRKQKEQNKNNCMYWQNNTKYKKTELTHQRIFQDPRLATIMALMVCILFSA